MPCPRRRRPCSSPGRLSPPPACRSPRRRPRSSRFEDLPPEAVEQAQDMHVLVRVDARDDRFAFHLLPSGSAACSAPGSPRHCTDGSATIQLACPIVRAHAPSGHGRTPGRGTPGLRQVGFEDGRRGVSRSVGHRPGHSQHQVGALRRGNRAPLPRPACARFPQNNYQCM